MRRRAETLNPAPWDCPPFRLMARPGLWTLGLVTSGLVVLTVFRLFPELDLWAASLFYVPVGCSGGDGNRFVAVETPLWQYLREIGLLVPRIAIVAAVVWLGWVLLGPTRKTTPMVARACLAAVSAALGPLLVVNWVLKAFWGRPRPFQTLQFGGDGFYVPPGTISDQCAANCSFVSGEAAAAFWLVGLVVLVPPRWRAGLLAGALAFATGVAVLRMAFGRHYLSDVTMSAFIALACVTATAWALQSPPGRRFVARLVAWGNERLARSRDRSL